MMKYYRHVEGFSDGTFVLGRDDETNTVEVIVGDEDPFNLGHEPGAKVSIPTDLYPQSYVEDMVKKGKWVEVPEAEVLAYLTSKG